MFASYFVHTGITVRKREVPQPTPLVLPFRKENMPADTPPLTWSQLSTQHSPQLPIQRLNHSCKAPAGLVQVQVAGPQTLAHGLLAGETDEGSVSVRACWSEGAGGSGGLLQAPLPQPPAQKEGPRSGSAARRHRERAFEHGQRDRTLAASSGHTNNLTARPTLRL